MLKITVGTYVLHVHVDLKDVIDFSAPDRSNGPFG